MFDHSVQITQRITPFCLKEILFLPRGPPPFQNLWLLFLFQDIKTPTVGLTGTGFKASLPFPFIHSLCMASGHLWLFLNPVSCFEFLDVFLAMLHMLVGVGKEAG